MRNTRRDWASCRAGWTRMPKSRVGVAKKLVSTSSGSRMNCVCRRRQSSDNVMI